MFHKNLLSLALLTDLYQLTMGYAYFEAQMAEREAVFHLFFRKYPFGGNYAVVAGLETAVRWLQNFSFMPDDLDYLATLKGNDNQVLFSNAYLDYLSKLKFDCTLAAIPEGTIVHPHQPLLRVRGSLIQAQLVETILLSILNFQTLIATKAARVCQAAAGDAVLEFGMRRAQGIDGAISASRAAYIGGCAATSNVLAGKLFGIPVKGTHAHSWVMCFDSELEAFEQYARAMPNNCIFLVDTYNTITGIKHAIEIGLKLKQQGYKLGGIRLDSGNMALLSIEARKMLDHAGFDDAIIVASNDLDEYSIAQLKQEGAKIVVWGVGTNLVTAQDQPALGGVYKLGAIKSIHGKWEHRIKLSEIPIKTSNPGMLQVRRFFNEQNLPVADVIFDELNPPNHWYVVDHNGNQSVWIDTDKHTYTDLLKPLYDAAGMCQDLPNLNQIRMYAQQQLQNYDANTFVAGLDQALYQRKQQLIERMQ